jgi:hypothetical protein
VEAVTVPHGPPPADNEARVRHSVYSALAYGAKGIQWWAWRPESQDCAKINAELKVLGPELVKLQSVGVFHTAPLPPQTTLLPTDGWVQSPTEQLLLGLFKNPEGKDFILAANRDWKQAHTATLNFAKSVKNIEMLDTQTGHWAKMNLADSGSRKTLQHDFAPGNGILLRVETR